MTRLAKTTLAVGMVTTLLLAQTATATPVTSGLVLWLDAGDTSTITSSGGLVTQWNDKSVAAGGTATDGGAVPTAFNFTASGAQSPTTGLETLNGNNLLTFDGANNYMLGPAVLTANDDDYVYYAVWKPHKNAVMAVYEQGQGTNSRSSALAVNAKYGFNGQNNDDHDIVPYDPNVWRVTDMMIDTAPPVPAATPNVYLTDNDTDYTGRTGNPDNLNVGTQGAIVGAKLQNRGEKFDGEIAEIMVYDRLLSGPERQSVRDYLDGKWGLNDQSPVTPGWYDFSDGNGAASLDGWTVTNQSSGATDVPYLQSAASESNRMSTQPCLTTAWDISGPSGGFEGDHPHGLLVAESPGFTIDAPGSITWQSVGGNPGSGIDPGTGTGAYPLNAMGVALVRESDGSRVMSTETTQQGHVSPYAFNVTSLVGDGETYHLEAVDNLRPSGNIGWGYVEWDNFQVPQAAAPGETIILMDPIINDGSFESNIIQTFQANPTLTLPSGMTVTETAHGGVLGHGAHSPNFKSDGSDAMFSDSGTTTANSGNLLGTTFYTAVSAGDVFEWSFDFNAWSADSGAAFALDFGNGPISLGSGLTGDADINTYHTISGTYTATAADAAGGQLVVLASLIRGSDNAYADNIRLSVTPYVSTAIPEPATMVAIGLAVGGLGGYVRRRRRG